jgi:hypothetical protein
VKSTLRCNPVSLQDLSICARSFHILAERYDIADFYMKLLNKSLAITHEMMLHKNAVQDHRLCDENVEDFVTYNMKPAEVPLPPPDIYSVVIRFQSMSLANR